MEFIGRLHPLVIHLPIGILLLAFLLEVLSRFRGYKKLGVAVPISILIGTLSAIMACVSGWQLSQEGGYDEPVIDQHKYSGLATAAMSLILLAIFYRIKYFNKAQRKKIRLLAFLPLVVLISVTGHLGGSLTHGEDFLFSSESNPKEGQMQPRVILPSDLNQAIIYSDLVQPLLESKCYSCHSAKKQKGKLRLDGEEWILKGGKNGEIIANGNPNESEMFKRLSLPIEDKVHMPPRGKDQLTSGEIDLVSQWISDGASFKMKVGEATSAAFFKKHISILAIRETQNWWPQESVPTPDASALQSLRQADVVLESLAENNNYLAASFIVHDTFPSSAWPHLIKLKDQLISLRLSGNVQSQSDWKKLSALKSLRMLYLDNTSVTDQDLSSLATLNNLMYINLAGTLITDQGLTNLNSLKSLQQIFLFGTTCTHEGVTQLKKQLPTCNIDFGGYQLKSLTTDTLIYRKK